MGAFYSLVLSSLLTYQFGCKTIAEEYSEAAYNLLPCMGSLMFLVWYTTRVLRAKSLVKFGVWQEFDHRSLVEVLLLPPSENTPVAGRNIFVRIWHGARKDWTRSIMHFRYSPRMLSMVMMCYCMLFNFLLWLGSEMSTFQKYLTSELSGGLCCDGDKCETGDMYLWQLWTRNSSTPMFDTARDSLNIKYDDCSQTEYLVNAVYWSFMVAGFVSAIMHIISVLNMVSCYRKHMLRFYRGDFNFISKFEPGPYVALTDALKYASYQVELYVHMSVARAPLLCPFCNYACVCGSASAS